MKVASNAFTVLQEKQKFQKVDQLSCCPSMDLIAILNHETSTLNVYRTISWQKILTLKSSDVPCGMTMITFNPSGSHLAIGHEDGSISLFSIEKGEVENEISSPSDDSKSRGAITSLHWTKFGHSQSVNNSSNSLPHVAAQSTKSSDRTPTFMYNPPSLNSGFSNFEQKQSYGTIDHAPNTVDLLITGDDKGNVSFLCFGTLHIGTIQVKQHLDVYREISAIHLSSDFKFLHVWSKQTMLEQRQTVCYLEQYGTTSLATHSDMLCGVMTHLKEITSLIGHVKKSFREINSQWTIGTRNFQAKMRLLEPLFKNYGSKESPQQHLSKLVPTGIISPALTQLFGQDLVEQSVSRMRKAFEGSCKAIQTLLYSHVLVSSNTMLFRLSELRGLIKSSNDQKFGGISVTELDKLLAAVKILNSEMEVVKRSLHESRADILLLFKWFSISIQTYSELFTSVTPAKLSRQEKSQLCSFIRRACAVSAQLEANADGTWTQMELSFGNSMHSILHPSSSAASSTQTGVAIPSLLQEIDHEWAKIVKKPSILAQSYPLLQTAKFMSSETHTTERFVVHCTNSSNHDQSPRVFLSVFLRNSSTICLIEQDTRVSQAGTTKPWNIGFLKLPTHIVIKSSEFYTSPTCPYKLSSIRDKLVVLFGHEMYDRDYVSSISFDHIALDAIDTSGQFPTAEVNLSELTEVHSITCISQEQLEEEIRCMSFRSACRVICCGGRGISCVISEPRALTVLDMEDNESAHDLQEEEINYHDDDDPMES